MRIAPILLLAASAVLASRPPPSSDNRPSPSPSSSDSPRPPPSSSSDGSSDNRSSGDNDRGNGGGSGGRNSPPPPSSSSSPSPVSAPSSAPSGPCAAIRTRYECRELPDTQRQALFAAFKRLMDGGQYDKFVDWHVSVTTAAHGVPEFLPWHREYLRRLEIELGVDLCYWDWASDAQVPEASPLLMPGWGGTNGNSNPNSCVGDGFWGSYSYKGECINTQWDGTSGGIGAFYSIDYIAKLITDNNSYDSFRVSYEGTAHARIHNGLGGMFSKMTSPANPVFFFHHTNVDRHWAIWQWAHPNNKNDFPKSTSTSLAVFNIPVSQVMDTQGPGYCYTYSNIDIINTGRSQLGLLQRRAFGDVDELVEERELDRSQHLVTLHRRAGCGNVDPASNYVAPPCDEDRSNLVDLRDVRPVPEWWIKMEGLNCTDVRRYEDDHRNYINTLNRIPGYVSSCALYNRPQLMGNLFKQLPKGHKFSLYAPGSTKPSELDFCETYRDDHDKGFKQIREYVDEHYKPLPMEALTDKMDKVLGCKLAEALNTVHHRRANQAYVPLKELEEEQEVCPAGYEEEDGYGSDEGRDGYGRRRRRHHGRRRHRSRSHHGRRRH